MRKGFITKNFIAKLVIGLAVGCQIALMTGCAASVNQEKDGETVQGGEIAVKNNSSCTIQKEGTYVLSGTAENYTVLVDADKDATVQIIFKDAVITNEDFPVLYVKAAEQCVVTVEGENTLAVKNAFTADGDTKTDAVIFSKDNLTLNGTGTFIIDSPYGNGITSKDDLEVEGGSYQISCALDGLEAKDSIHISAGDFSIQARSDGIQANSYLVIDGGEFDISSSEGLEATNVKINDGTIKISASDDGINASQKDTECEVLIEINGGDITVVMGEGDTDGIDANGSIIVNGGTIDITCNSPFDYEKEATYNGGTIIVNGTTVNEISQSMMGGPNDKTFFGEPRDKDFRNRPRMDNDDRFPGNPFDGQ